MFQCLDGMAAGIDDVFDPGVPEVPSAPTPVSGSSDPDPPTVA